MNQPVIIGSKPSVAYTTTKTEHAGNKVYKNGTLGMILTEEGYVTLSAPTYHYYLKDHQGNNRVVINQAGTVLQVNHYYPFGGLFGEGVQDSNQPYRYNGKELGRLYGLDMYDYGARHYDAATGRWGTPDLLMEKYYPISPYVYVANNPVKYIDPNGKWIESAWDAFSLVTGAKSFIENVKVGNIGGAIVDGIGVVADAVAIALPVVPGGAGATIKAVRAGNKAIDAVTTGNKVDNAVSGGKAAGKVGDGKAGARFVGDTDGKLIDTQATPKGSYTQPDGTRTDVLQDRPHFDKKSQTNHGTTHTHERYRNTDPNTGKVHQGGL